MKNINDLTIAEFKEFEKLTKNSDIMGVFDLFKIDVKDMTLQEMNRTFEKITSFNYETRKLQKYYYIGDRKYKTQLNLTKIKAGQFIDFQSYMSGNKKLEEILSIFLIPMKRRFGFWFEQKYAEYDMYEVQKEIYNNFQIADARTLSDFFLHLSTKLLVILKDSLVKRAAMERVKKSKKK